MKQQLAQALLESGTAFEINLSTMLLADDLPEQFKRDYLAYAKQLQDMGVPLSIGSDNHSVGDYNSSNFALAAGMISAAGIDLEKNMFSLRRREPFP
jgi:histidinol phosphatase-like PHP family hydrolase